MKHIFKYIILLLLCFVSCEKDEYELEFVDVTNCYQRNNKEGNGLSVYYKYPKRIYIYKTIGKKNIQYYSSELNLQTITNNRYTHKILKNEAYISDNDSLYLMIYHYRYITTLHDNFLYYFNSDKIIDQNY